MQSQQMQNWKMWGGHSGLPTRSTSTMQPTLPTSRSPTSAPAPAALPSRSPKNFQKQKFPLPHPPRHQLESRIPFLEVDLLTGLRPETFDFVVSNPPYVGESEEDQVQLEVRKFEPRNAVFAGPTGLEVIARLIPQAQAALRPGGWLVLEISGTIAAQVQHLLQSWNDVLLIPDLQSIPRIARARKARR